jgi:lysophospholipase L1-like esterase
MARVKYFDPNTGKWEYADSCFAVGGNDSGGNVGYPNWSHLKWYVMGDSLTAQDNDYTPKRYYDFVHEKTGIQLIVDGIGGTGYGAGVSNAQSFLDRVKNIPDDIDVVTIFGSGNDIRYLEVANVPIYDVLSWLCLNRPGLRVIVVPPSPWKGYRKREDPWKAYCDRLQVCALACDFRYLSDMSECPPFNPNHTGHMEKFFTTDPEGIHPNEAGHEALAPYFYNALALELALKL